MSMLKKLHIFEFNKYKVKKHYLEIPENIDNIKNLHDYYKEKTKQLCEHMLFYINNGNILRETVKLKDIDKDIILINVLQSVRFSSYNELISNTTDDIRTFLNNVFANSRTNTTNDTTGSIVNNTLESTTPYTFSVYEEGVSQNNVQPENINNTVIQGTSTITIDECDEAKSDNEHCENDIDDNTSGDNTQEDEDENEGVDEDGSGDNNQEDENESISHNISEDGPSENNTSVINSTENNADSLPDLVSVNGDLSEVVSIINNISNNSINNIFNLSSNVISSGQVESYNNISVSDTNNVSDKYKEEFDRMISMGFTDEKLVLMSLNLAQGNLENAINLYLADYQV